MLLFVSSLSFERVGSHTTTLNISILSASRVDDVFNCLVHFLLPKYIYFEIFNLLNVQYDRQLLCLILRT